MSSLCAPCCLCQFVCPSPSGVFQAFVPGVPLCPRHALYSAFCFWSLYFFCIFLYFVFLKCVRLCLGFLCILTKVFSTFPFFQFTENASAIPNSYCILFWRTLIYVTEMVLLFVIHFIGDNILVSNNLVIANFRRSGHGKNTKLHKLCSEKHLFRKPPIIIVPSHCRPN